MGKPVRIRRGIATVIPTRESGVDSQIASPGRSFRIPAIYGVWNPQMTQNTPFLRNTHRSALALFALTIPSLAQAPPDLDPVVVSALRISQKSTSASSMVTVLDPGELEKTGINNLSEALNFSPGVISTSTSGQTGAAGSLFVRGMNTAYSTMVVDGFRISDSTTPLGNALGGGRLHDIGRLEVLRGPHGAVYGGESIGGVLWLETARGNGKPSGSATWEAGSFDTWAGRTHFQGQEGNLSYFVAGSYEDTANDSEFQHFHQATTALRLEGKVAPDWTVGTTFRGTDSYFENSGDSDDRVDSALATLYAAGEISDRWTARFHAGYHQEFYDSDSVFGNYGTDLRASGISTDHDIRPLDNVSILVGGFLHQTSFGNTIGTDESRHRFGAHTAAEWSPITDLTFSGAIRWEDYDEFGDKGTWRLGATYTFAKTATTLRGGYGTSFRSPSFLDLFGSSFGPGNPTLDPESAGGWDIGISQRIGGDHHIEVSYFRNRVTDRIQTIFGTGPVNISGHSETEGIELGLHGSFFDGVIGYRAAWTHLRKSLSEQPKNAGTASLDWKATEKALIGIGATHLADRSWGGSPIESYTTARLYGAYQLTDNVKIHARLENAFDEEYELASFYGNITEGAGRGAYVGLTIDW
jgi:vitamin B12 transporter